MRRVIEEIQPDLVHAMRIPFEGILAALAVYNVPLLISVWGNDFTLHAKHYPLVAVLTRRAMQRADALHCDCFRDLRLAHTWGFPDSRPGVVLPGAGGVQLDVFYPGFAKGAVTVMDDNVPLNSNVPVVINPRGFRGYVRNDTFFRAIPLVLKQRPDVIFLGVAMKGNPVAENWVKRLGISHAVHLLRPVSRTNMADLFRLADVSVSPSEHDGTPNTLLEAMACGCFPVAGDIESVKEWIIDGVNGLLCDPTSPESLAQAVLRALSDAELRQRARETNLKLIAERAEYGKVMTQAEVFYREVAEMRK
jgi:glycosyltransferase involved in cell wall biosynthesis